MPLPLPLVLGLPLPFWLPADGREVRAPASIHAARTERSERSGLHGPGGPTSEEPQRRTTRSVELASTKGRWGASAPAATVRLRRVAPLFVGPKSPGARSGHGRLEASLRQHDQGVRRSLLRLTAQSSKRGATRRRRVVAAPPSV